MKPDGKETIVYEWEKTGRLEIAVHGNQYALLRFDPAPSLFENPPLQFRKTLANPAKMDLQSHNTPKNTPRKSRNFASHEHTYGETEERRYMKESRNTEPFAILSRQAKEHIIGKDFGAYSEDLREMSLVVESEGKYEDALKISMMKFHIDLSGLDSEPHIDRENIEVARNSIERKNYSSESIENLFRKTIHANMTPSHCFTVSGSLRIFKLALDGAERKIGEILAIASKKRPVC